MSNKVIIKAKKTVMETNTKTEDEKTLELEVDKMMGLVYAEAKFKQRTDKDDWIQCIYCEKMVHKNYYIVNMYHCINCWGWMNIQDYDLELGIYKGEQSQNDVNEGIKKAYKVHNLTKCKLDECIFNKIKKLYENKLLHKNLVEILELNKKKELKAINFNNKNKNLDVNYEESYIVI